MTEKLILQALQQATIVAVAGSIVPSLPIKFVSRLFTIPGDQKYLELVYIPNNLTNEYWDGSRIYRGIYRLILHWSVKDEGVYTPLDVITSISSYFTKSLVLQNVKITDHPNLTGIIETGTESLFPVSVPYQFFERVTP